MSDEVNRHTAASTDDICEDLDDTGPYDVNPYGIICNDCDTRIARPETLKSLTTEVIYNHERTKQHKRKISSFERRQEIVARLRMKVKKQAVELSDLCKTDKKAALSKHRSYLGPKGLFPYCTGCKIFVVNPKGHKIHDSSFLKLRHGYPIPKWETKLKPTIVSAPLKLNSSEFFPLFREDFKDAFGGDVEFNETDDSEEDVSDDDNSDDSNGSDKNEAVDHASVNGINDVDDGVVLGIDEEGDEMNGVQLSASTLQWASKENLKPSWAFKGQLQRMLANQCGENSPILPKEYFRDKTETCIYVSVENFFAQRKGKQRWGLDDFEYGGRLGEGSFGCVFLAREKKTGYVVALKAIPRGPKSDEERRKVTLFREIDIQISLPVHPNILSMFGYFWNQSEMFLIMEYAPGGSLFHALQKTKEGRFNEAQAANVITELSSALIHCHAHKIIHRDIKIENLLLGLNGEIKVADFGLSIREMAEGAFKYSLCGTPNMFALEMAKDLPYCKSVDLWSVGCVLYTLLTGMLPFDGGTYVDIFEQIKKSKCPTFPSVVSSAAKHLIKWLMAANPKKRIPLIDVMSHKWIRDVNINDCKKGNKNICGADVSTSYGNEKQVGRYPLLPDSITLVKKKMQW